MSSAAVFDGLAARYDELWTDAPEGRSQRDQVWRWVDPLFRAGESILDIGCGTGVDAAHFVERGLRVHAIDASPEMILVAKARAGSRFTCEVRCAQEIGGLAGRYEGMISNFGALNCVEDLEEVARDLARIVRPGGRVAICLMGRFCLAETLRCAVRGQFAKAVRRWKGHARSSLGITVWYPRMSELRGMFEGFELERWVGIGGWPAGLSHWPLMRGMTDHRLAIFRRI